MINTLAAVTAATRPRAETIATEDALASPSSGRRPSSQFRLRRAPTASKEYQMLSSGLEPGLNPNSDGLADELTSSLHTDCQITVVEYSEDQISQYELWNDGLKEFLDKPRPDWVKVRRVVVSFGGRESWLTVLRYGGSTAMGCPGTLSRSSRGTTTSIL
jgi:hypothetical protein